LSGEIVRHVCKEMFGLAVSRRPDALGLVRGATAKH
jgi:hypothetical protein